MKPRKTYKITIAMLADYLGKSRSTVYQWNKQQRSLAFEGFESKIKSGEIPDPRIRK